jgi:hypothetical protein
VFDLPMVRGSGTALRQPANVLISETLARQYFGTTDPIGQTLTISVDKTANYRIAGVFRDLPKNSDFKISLLVPLPTTPPSPQWFHWGSTSLQTFLRFDTPEAARVRAETASLRQPARPCRYGQGCLQDAATRCSRSHGCIWNRPVRPAPVRRSRSSRSGSSDF